MNLIKRRKQAVARRAAGLNGKGTAEDLNAAAKNDEEIESFLDTTKLAYKLSLKNTTHRLNYFFDDLDIYRVLIYVFAVVVVVVAAIVYVFEVSFILFYFMIRRPWLKATRISS